MGGFSKDNLTGFLLALSSSAFIGASFIIKKQGLRRAAAVSGVSAGVGGFSYLSEPLWWLGMTTMIIGEIANFVAYAFAPAVLVTPLGALSIIVSAVLAHFILKERLENLGILGCGMCIAGSVVVVVNAPQEHPIESVQQVWTMATQTAFLLYIATVVVLVFILIFYFAPQCGHTNILVFTGICSLMGSLSVMSVKALGTSLKLTFEGRNQLIYPETWFFMFVVAICVITQMNYLNKVSLHQFVKLASSNIHVNSQLSFLQALDTFNTAVVSPIYYVMFTSLTILASVIMFKDWDDQSVGSIASEICGFLVVLSGTILLHSTKGLDRSSTSSSFRSGTSAMPPLLSAQFCSGNGEMLKKNEQEEEEGSSSEDFFMKRKDMFTQ